MPLPKHEYTAEDYWALPDGTRAELIDGELWDLASPSRTHQRLALELAADLRDFIREHCDLRGARRNRGVRPRQADRPRLQRRAGLRG